MCKKTLIHGLLLVLLLSFMALPALAGDIKVVELYSAQGCPSCPPADRLMQDLVREPGLIAFACHVTYFDTPAAKDPVASPVCDLRQRAFKKAGVTQKIYTPQIFVNGAAAAQGNKENLVRAAIASQPALPTIHLKKNGRDLAISMPSISLEKLAVLVIVAYDENVRGENMNYMNVVKRMRGLMNWDGSPITLSLPIGYVEADGFIALAQYADGSDILAAGKTH